jgi:hypothetical protein
MTPAEAVIARGERGEARPRSVFEDLLASELERGR